MRTTLRSWLWPESGRIEAILREGEFGSRLMAWRYRLQVGVVCLIGLLGASNLLGDLTREDFTLSFPANLLAVSLSLAYLLTYWVTRKMPSLTAFILLCCGMVLMAVAQRGMIPLTLVGPVIVLTYCVVYPREAFWISAGLLAGSIGLFVNLHSGFDAALLQRLVMGQLIILLAAHLMVAFCWKLIIELHESRMQANQATEAKTRFLNAMSHELRTPLNGIQGMIFALQRTQLNPLQAELLADLEASGQHLNSLVTDVLDFSKLEAGKLVLAKENISLSELMHAAQVMVGHSASAKGLAFQVVIEPDCPRSLTADRKRLLQILINLLNNGIKFTAQGKVTLKAQRAKPRGPVSWVRLGVYDTGVGITPEQQDGLFKPFVQGSADTFKQYGGTGLGLALARDLVQFMGGEIGFQSKVGQGSDFWIELPGEDACLLDDLPGQLSETKARHLAQGFNGWGLTALVVDDVGVNRKVATIVLDHMGIASDSAEHGAKALEMLATGPEQYDFVLMDMYMPGMGGVETTRKIREELGLKTLPVIGLTGATEESELARARASGMNAVLHKPLDVLALHTVITALVGESMSETEAIDCGTKPVAIQSLNQFKL